MGNTEGGSVGMGVGETEVLAGVWASQATMSKRVKIREKQYPHTLETQSLTVLRSCYSGM